RWPHIHRPMTPVPIQPTGALIAMFPSHARVRSMPTADMVSQACTRGKSANGRTSTLFRDIYEGKIHGCFIVPSCVVVPMQPPRLRAPLVLVHGLLGFDRVKVCGYTIANYFPGIDTAYREAGNHVLMEQLSPPSG